MTRIVASSLGVLALAGTIMLVDRRERRAGPGTRTRWARSPSWLCIVAVVVMILLGVTLGGRNNPRDGRPILRHGLHGHQLRPRTGASTARASWGAGSQAPRRPDQPGDTA
jgi:hypothetical protein